jgi:secondary thiamine-phosphate synthase enzyme
VFVKHTSASLVIMENADPSARRDLEKFFEKLVPEDTPWFIHTLEGPDDMPSHIRMALTRTSETIPVIDGRMTSAPGRESSSSNTAAHPHHREIAVSVRDRSSSG